jgi:hypothetical protein
METDAPTSGSSSPTELAPLATPPALPRLVVVAGVSAALFASQLALRRGPGPELTGPPVSAAVAGPEQIRAWQEGLQSEGLEKLLLDYDPGSVLERVGLDSDQDGRPDLLAIYRAGELVRVTPSGARRGGAWEVLQQGNELTRVESDRDGDGIIDAWTFTKGGKIDSVHVDGNGDGRVDRWERYEKDTLVEIASDNDGDGRADQWEGYGPDGAITSLRYDTDGDGKPDASLDNDGTP